MTLLIADRLCKAFGGVIAVNGVSFEVAPGEMLALIGPNGAGKTTLLNLLGGQLRPDTGRIRLGGEDVTRAGAAAICRLGVGRGFQISAPFGSMTVRENVQTAMIAARREFRGWWRPVRDHHRSRADHLLARVGLLEQAERGVGRLSAADLRRLDLALALAHRPRLLLLDEPTTGTGAADGRAIMTLVRALCTTEDVAVLVASHDMDLVFGLADRVLVLDGGRLIADGRPDTVRADPAFRAAYLGDLA